MIRTKLYTIVMVASVLAVGGVTSPIAYADDSATSFSVKRGAISIPDEHRSFFKEFSQLAAKYPAVVIQSRIMENMCEAASPQCFYVASWTACCCDVGGQTTCDAWPPQ
jgi:hypothetical protein